MFDSVHFPSKSPATLPEKSKVQRHSDVVFAAQQDIPVVGDLASKFQKTQLLGEFASRDLMSGNHPPEKVRATSFSEATSEVAKPTWSSPPYKYLFLYTIFTYVSHTKKCLVNL